MFFSDVKDLLNILQLFQHNFLIFLTNIICAYCSAWYYALASCLTPCVVISMSFIVGWRLWYLVGMYFCHECYIDWDLAYRMTFFSLVLNIGPLCFSVGICQCIDFSHVSYMKKKIIYCLGFFYISIGLGVLYLIQKSLFLHNPSKIFSFNAEIFYSYFGHVSNCLWLYDFLCCLFF